LPECRAIIGVIAGSGRPEKPFLKAGTKFFAMRAKNKLWPIVSGTSMNSVNHPFGGKSSHAKGIPTQSSRNAPPGRKVGKIAPKRTGRKKR
jgi:large subunit ribosomal protein L2